MFLGGGSNVLFTQNFDGLLVLNRIQGKELIAKNNEKYSVSAYSGEVWHEFVIWTIENGFYGLENMSLIPGTVGAAPIQNIGAYGVELKDNCTAVHAINLKTGELRIFSNAECNFGYRESIFKRELSGQYFILKLIFELSENSLKHTRYGTIQEELNKKGIANPTHKDISDTVIEIRSSKLPNPQLLGNAGSFFKNPIVEKSLSDKLLLEYPQMPNFSDALGIKIPAGWLIEQCGFKGYREGEVGSHQHQALVIVNYGNATGKEVLDYSEKIIQTVKNKFGITLEREVNMI